MESFTFSLVRPRHEGMKVLGYFTPFLQLFLRKISAIDIRHDQIEARFTARLFFITTTWYNSPPDGCDAAYDLHNVIIVAKIFSIYATRSNGWQLVS